MMLAAWMDSGLMVRPAGKQLPENIRKVNQMISAAHIEAEMVDIEIVFKIFQ